MQNSINNKAKYFPYLQSIYKYFIDQNNQLVFDSCSKNFQISTLNTKMNKTTLIQEDDPLISKTYYYSSIVKNSDNLYYIQNLKNALNNQFKGYSFDVVIMYGNKYITSACKKYFYKDNFLFSIPDEYYDDSLKIIVYSLNSMFQKFLIEGQLSAAFGGLAIKNLSGSRNLKFVLKDSQNEVLDIKDQNIFQDHVVFNLQNNELSGAINLSSSFGYQIQNYKTIIIKKGGNTNEYSWSDDYTLNINHGLNGIVNFNINEQLCDSERPNKLGDYNVYYNNQNDITINFNNSDHLSGILSMTIYKVGE